MKTITGAMLLGELARMLHNKESMVAGMEKAAQIAVKEAKSYPGHYQPGWKELAESTKESRLNLGFSANEPLKRTGKFKDSIKSERHGDRVYFGATSDDAAFHEFGTSKEPARPVLGPAIENKRTEIEEAAGGTVIAKLGL